MYVCVCKAVTDRQIHQAVGEGVCTLRQLRDRLGVAAGCARCAECARDVLQQALLERARQSDQAA